MLFRMSFEALRGSRRLQRLYVQLIEKIWGVDVEAVFDREYYLSANPDVAAGGLDPAFHFLWFGAREDRSPHPFFDVRFYKQKYPDIAKARLNPLIHYLRFGGREARNPHAGFDSLFYLATNPDVSEGGWNPLVHFVSRGIHEGRSPHPDFDAARYAELATGTRFESAIQAHFAATGAPILNRPPIRPKDLAPVSRAKPVATPATVDIVVPVYKGLEETRRCLESVLQSQCSCRPRLVVIDDCSPGPDLRAYLRDLAAVGSITLLENKTNIGFVQTVNRGMSVSHNDVVLLNSDTVVSAGWLDRLSACAYRNHSTGTVTPFSNNATICSYPVFCGSRQLPAGIDAAALDRAFALVNAGRAVEIPTAVGFCMYIRRSCLSEVGLFDAKTFGFGYGEENDFCMRATHRHWRHMLACDVFVEHTGSVSFGPALERREAAGRALLRKHPKYSELVQRHIQQDPAQLFRIAVTAYRICNSGKEVVAAITHAAGGGVAQHLHDLEASSREDRIWIDVAPDPKGRVVVSSTYPFFELSLTLDAEAEYDSILTLLRSCGVARLHIHHVLGHKLDVRKLTEDLGVPFVFTVHDYYGVCPQVTLSDAEGVYCGEQGIGQCNRCIARRPSFGAWDIQHWRDSHAWLYGEAESVMAPSVDTARRIAKYHPNARVSVVRPPSPAAPPVVVRTVAKDAPLRIAVLGTISRHKGLKPLRRCAGLARRRGLPLEFILIGRTEHGRREDFRVTGPYQSDDALRRLGEATPHVVWFPTQVPETFSYTLSAAVAAGLPVAVPDIGAFPERVAGRPCSWVLAWDTTPEEWIEFFLRIRHEHFGTTSIPGSPRAPESIASRLMQ